MNQELQQETAGAKCSSVDEWFGKTNLTRNQIGFWLGQRISPSSSIYNMGQLFRLQCDLDPTLFQAAFDALLTRSDALRTQFHQNDGIPWQTVSGVPHYDVPVVDLSLEKDVEGKLTEWYSDRIGRPMDLAECSFDSVLIRLGEAGWAWYLCIHHLIGDGTSVDLMFRYVDRFYELALRGELENADPLPQFASYLSTEHNYRQSDACRKDAKYWESKLAMPCEPATFYGNKRSGGGNLCVRRMLDLDPSRTERLRRTAGQVLGGGMSEDLNSLIAYLAVLAAYQFRVSNQSVLAVGVPFHNRASAVEKQIVGLLMEVVPLTLEVGPDDTFPDILLRAQSEVFAALRHYRYGATNAARSKTYDVMLNLLPSSITQFAGSPAASEWIHSGEWNESLTVQIQQTGVADRLYFDTNRELFRDNLACRAPEHFINMLDTLCRQPDLPLRKIDLLTAEERELLRGALSNPGRTPGSHETIVTHFEAAVARSPESTAVVEGARRVDYRTLDGMANRLAAYLRLRGVHPGDRVGVCMPRCIERIVALVAILKAGAAYVPVDETWPAERIRMTLQDAAVRRIVAKGMSDDGLSAVTEQELIDVDEAAEQVDLQSAESTVVEGSPSDVAYINFTSGSTGRPKGVLVPHSGVIRLTVDADYVELDERTVILHMSSISFDASTFEVWAALLAGGTLVLPSETLLSAPSIRRYISEYGVTTLFVTTSLFNALIDEDPAAFVGAKHLFTGGEAASTAHMARAVSALPDTTLLHVYGPTESTTFATCHKVPQDLPFDQPVPIGKPISNTSAYVLDEFLNDVPVGAAGELYVSGAGVALGYAAQPELSDERFIVLQSHGNVRAYRTGDIVRLREDGNLLFLGRRDNQVKVRGFRIELDEVELALNAMAEVRRAVVTLHEAADGTKGLAAYIVPDRPQITISMLRSVLREGLPENMMPRWYVLIDELPLATTGKVDRRRLPEPDTASEGQLGVDLEPMTPLEERLAGIWCELLRLPAISPDADFFELGGDSIVAIQFAARASRIGFAFDAEDIFENPTIRLLSRMAVQRDGELPERSAIEGEVPLSPVQHWFFEQGFAEPDHWNMAIALDCAESVDVEAAERAINAVLEQHDALRARFARAEGRWQQFILPAAPARALQVVDIEGFDDEKLSEVLAASALSAQSSLDIEAGDVVRVLLFDAGRRGKSRLLLIAHHLVMDGVSWRILLNDFDNAYRQAIGGHPIELPMRTSSLRDFAAAREKYLSSPDFEIEGDYWRKMDATSSIDLPVDNVDGGNAMSTVGSSWGSLTADETQTLITLVPKAFQVPVNHVLVAVLVRTVCEWSSRDSLRIDLEGHGRERIGSSIDLSRTIGWFTTIFPTLLRNTPSGVEDLLRSISGAISEVPCKGIGYGISRYLSSASTATLNGPASPVSFNYLGQFDQILPEDAAFALADIFSGSTNLVTGSVSPRNHRTHELDVVAHIEAGRMKVGWFFSADRLTRRTVDALRARYFEYLRQVIQGAAEAGRPPPASSKYADSGLDNEQLNDVLAQFGIGATPT